MRNVQQARVAFLAGSILDLVEGLDAEPEEVATALHAAADILSNAHALEMRKAMIAKIEKDRKR